MQFLPYRRRTRDKDAVSADRCYRAALPLEECFEIIQNGSGQDFDPILVEIFMDLREEVEKVKEGNFGEVKGG